MWTTVVHPFIGLLSNQARLSRKQKKEEKAFEVNGNTLVPSIHCPRKTLANIKKVKRTQWGAAWLPSFPLPFSVHMYFPSLTFSFFSHFNFYLLFAFSQCVCFVSSVSNSSPLLSFSFYPLLSFSFFFVLPLSLLSYLFASPLLPLISFLLFPLFRYLSISFNLSVGSRSCFSFPVVLPIIFSNDYS